MKSFFTMCLRKRAESLTVLENTYVEVFESKFALKVFVLRGGNDEEYCFNDSNEKTSTNSSKNYLYFPFDHMNPLKVFK